MWCWWCCHPFENEPLNMPYKYDEMRRTFHTAGFFCSWPCMKAYNLESNHYRMYEIQQNITLMRKQCYGKTEGLRCAPKRQALKVFGGTMTIEEFRGEGDAPIITRPNIHIPEAVRTVTVTNEKSNDRQLLHQIQTATTQNDQLKLKRTKPLKRAESALEKSLNLKRNR
jgi:hypothetical protein